MIIPSTTLANALAIAAFSSGPLAAKTTATHSYSLLDSYPLLVQRDCEAQSRRRPLADARGGAPCRLTHFA